MERRPARAEAIACLGGAMLLACLVLPLVWFDEDPTGGLDGNGGGAPTRSLTAIDAFGAWLVPMAIGASIPLVDLVARFAGRHVPWELRLLLVGCGLLVLLVAVFFELTYDLPPCCDMIYVQPVARIGFLLGGVSATLLLFGTLASWPGRMPWHPRRLAQPE
jgi:hypothetical protein